MEIIENDIEKINAILTEMLIGASFDKFCYAGLYSMIFTLNPPVHNFVYCNLDIATKIVIKNVSDPSEPKHFSMEDFHKIWGKTIDRVKLEADLSLSLFFDGSFLCKISSYLEDPEGLFDMRWSIYHNKDSNFFSVWVSDEKNIYLKNGLKK